MPDSQNLRARSSDISPPVMEQASKVFPWLLATFAGAVFWTSCSPKSSVTQEQVVSGTNTNRALSDATASVLKSLNAPVEIRFYSILDPASTTEELRAFAGRTDNLLAWYEYEAAGKILLSRHTNRADARAATSYGLTVFNMDKGDACFLGLTVVGSGQKEIMARLSPDWEAALESDLSRAIARVASAKPANAVADSVAVQPDEATVAEIKKLIPDLGSVSLAEGKQRLRDAALKEAALLARELQQRVKDAEQAVREAGEVEKSTALKKLQQAELERTQKIKDLAARTQARIEVLEQIKAK